MKNAYIPKLRGKKAVLIAAVIAVLLCGTAATAGLLWLKPDVFPNKDGHTLLINQGYVELSDDAIQIIMENRLPERNNNCFLNFETVAEWQNFFELPLVVSNLMVPDETNGLADYGDGILVPNGSIDSIVTSDGDRLCLMITSMFIDRVDEQTAERLWDGTLQIYAALSEESTADAKSTVKVEGAVKEETLMEATSSAGIPYVIRKIVSGENGETVQFFLYYGYESVMYELWITAHSPEEEIMIADDLKIIADTLQIMYSVE